MCAVPWNFPLQITAWKLAPALAAGNTVILKVLPPGCDGLGQRKKTHTLLIDVTTAGGADFHHRPEAR